MKRLNYDALSDVMGVIAMPLIALIFLVLIFTAACTYLDTQPTDAIKHILSTLNSPVFGLISLAGVAVSVYLWLFKGLLSSKQCLYICLSIIAVGIVIFSLPIFFKKN